MKTVIAFLATVGLALGGLLDNKYLLPYQRNQAGSQPEGSSTNQFFNSVPKDNKYLPPYQRNQAGSQPEGSSTNQFFNSVSKDNKYLPPYQRNQAGSQPAGSSTNQFFNSVSKDNKYLPPYQGNHAETQPSSSNQFFKASSKDSYSTSNSFNSQPKPEYGVPRFESGPSSSGSFPQVNHGSGNGFSTIPGGQFAASNVQATQSQFGGSGYHSQAGQHSSPSGPSNSYSAPYNKEAPSRPFDYNSASSQQYSQGIGQNSGSSQSAEATAKILRYENNNNGDGNYFYAYETDNGISAQEQGSLQGEAITADGSYSYTAPDGQVISVKYVADENGFRPEGDHLPTPPPIPEAILKSIEQNKAEAAAGGKPEDGFYQEDTSSSNIYSTGYSEQNGYQAQIPQRKLEPAQRGEIRAQAQFGNSAQQTRQHQAVAPNGGYQY